MTLCIAALCDNAKTLILVTDNLLSMGFVSSELPVKKAQRIHPDWWLLLAGGTSSALEVIEACRGHLADKRQYTQEEVAAKVIEQYQMVRLRSAENEHLKSRGWNLEQFKGSGLNSLGVSTYMGIDSALRYYDLGVELLIVGFGPDGEGHVSSIKNPGIVTRHDLPGVYAIGVGMFGALYFMYYREMSSALPLLEALYYAYEAYAFGYQAGGVGQGNIYVVRQGQTPIELSDKAINRLDKLWNLYQPPWPTKSKLNGLWSLPEIKDLKPASQSGPGSNAL